jgi:hypothetical protein
MMTITKRLNIVGNSSIIADQIALKLVGEDGYVITGKWQCTSD